IERFPSVKLDHIISVEVLETAFDPPPKSEVKALLSRVWESMWEEEREVALWFSRRGSLIDEAGCDSSSLRPSVLDNGYMMTLHVSGWLQPHPSAMNRGSHMELLSQASMEKHFSDYARKLWQTSRVLLQERAKGPGAPNNLDK
ncbi:MAG: WYL domain-containing protein, partial [Chloroflexi bacterium]|nr:WYL domain-containing protein [Chloroflexota bacterium]